MNSGRRVRFTDGTPVEGGIAQVLQALALDRKSIPRLRFPAIKGGEFNGLALPSGGHLSVRKRSLLLTLTQGRLAPFEEEEDDSKPEGAKLVLPSGAILEAEYSHISHRGMHFDVHAGVRRRIEVQLDSWHLHGRRRACAWLGRLDGARFRSHNLAVWRDRRGVHRGGWAGLRLGGNYVWYLLARKERPPIAVVEADGDRIDFERLGADFRALEFVLGLPLRLDLLVGVTPELRVVAACGPVLGHRQVGETLPHPPVPDGWHRDEFWQAEFFRRLAPRLVDADMGLVIATGGYVDSLDGHIDGQYLMAQVALEAASGTFASEAREILVGDQRAWRQWVKAHAEEVSEFATDPEAAMKLIGKLHQAIQPPSGESVARAARALGLQLPTRVLDEVRQRNIPAHSYVMTRGEYGDIEVELERIRVIRAMLALLVAAKVGYRGPLCGWELDHRREPRLLDWWPTQEAAESAQRYVCEIVE